MCVIALTCDATCVQVERDNNACNTDDFSHNYHIVVITIIVDVFVF